MEATDNTKNEVASFADYLMAEESDRGCALVAAAALDDALEQALRALFSVEKHAVRHAVDPMFAGLGPLSTLSSKIRLAYAIGFVDRDGFRDLEIIRKIRNEFAHTRIAVYFGDEKIAAMLLQLALGSKQIEGIPAQPKSITWDTLPKGPHRDAFAKETGLVQRNKAGFVLCVVLHMEQLKQNAHRINSAKSK